MRRVYASRVGSLAREAIRTTWPRWRRADAEDNENLTRILRYTLREDSCAIDVGSYWNFLARPY